MTGDEENPTDYEQALKLLESRRQQMQTLQGPMAQSGGSFGSALNTLNKWQGQSQAAPQRQMPADEAPPKEDNAKTYWAMALSLLGGGRDLGTVLQNATDSYNKRLGAWEARNSPDAKLDRSMKLAQLEAMDRAPQKEAFDQATRLASVEQADRGQAIQQQQFALTQDQQLFMKKADEVFDRAKQKAQFNHADESQANAQAHSEKLAFYAQHGMDERHASELENQRNMQNQRIEAENARNAADNQTRLDVANATAQGKKNTLIPGTSYNGPEGQMRYEHLDPTQKTKADKDILEGRIVSEHVKQLRELLQQPYSIANKKTYDGLIQSLVGNKSDENATGVLSNPEYIRTVRNLPEYTPNTVLGRIAQIDGPRSAIEVAQGRNPAFESLDALQASARRMAGIHSRLYGINDDELTAPLQPAAAPGPQQAVVAPAPGPQQAAAAPHAQAPAFDMTKLPGQVQLLGPTAKPAAATAEAAPPQTPMVPAQDEMAPAPDEARSAMPQQLPPMRDAAGHLKQPMSYREMQDLIAKHWRPLNG